MSRVGAIIGKFGINEAERFFLAVKELLFLGDSKSQAAVHKFMDALLRSHPRLMELQGNRIFKSILAVKTTDDMKLKVYLIFFHS